MTETNMLLDSGNPDRDDSKPAEPTPGPRLAAIAPPAPGDAAAANVTWPRYRSLFGGLWIDLSNAEEVLQGKLELGAITADEAGQLRSFMDNGYIVFENAVPTELLDRLDEDVERAKRGAFDSVYVEHWVGKAMHVSPSTGALWSQGLVRPKLLDLHSASAAARAAQFAPRIRRFLQMIFERPPMAFQTLYFTRGTEQPMHQDTAYVVVSSPLELAASWIALEDIQPESGKLEYYAGSHKLADFVWRGRFKAKPFDVPVSDPEHNRFLQSLHDESVKRGLERVQFQPKRGDALIWHADLAHGGSKVTSPGATRRSLVTHYCPKSQNPGFFDYAGHSDRLECGDGCYYCYVVRG
jgi:hypothetical protein